MYQNLFLFSIICISIVYGNEDQDIEWEDSDVTSMLWGAISKHDTQSLMQILDSNNDNAFVRASDGRGPMFWAYEFGHKDGILLLQNLGIKNDLKDSNGKTPIQLGIDNAEMNKHRKYTPPQAFSNVEEDDEDVYGDEDYEDDEL